MRKGRIIKVFGLVFLLAAMFVPLSQELFVFFEIKPLKGVYDVAAKPEFSKKNWFDGSFQKAEEKYMDQYYGFRNFMVRAHNQLDYQLYGSLNARGMVAGKDYMLYGTNYIEAYLGDDYLGELRIDGITGRLRKIQEKLNEKNKTLLVILAPGKGTFYPESFPKKYRREKKRNNHEELVVQLKDKKINTIDLNTWFLSMKNKTAYPLFNNLGIHWSQYGSSLAYDSIVSYIEKKRTIDLPDDTTIRIEFPDTLRSFDDDDIFQSSNLLFDMPYIKAVYPISIMKDETGKTRPNCLTIGDSYWWGIRNTGTGNTVFKEQRFWYYNKDAYPGLHPWESVGVSTLNFGEEIEKSDVIILFNTESNLQHIGHHFIEQLFRYLFPGENVYSPEEREILVGETIKGIRQNKDWMKGIKERAEKEKIPVDSILLIDAIWQMDH
jgi:hypothetical protein